MSKGYRSERESGRKIDSICSHVKGVCNTETHGGRCVVVSDSTCMLTDYEEWNGDMHDRVKDRYPDVDIICTHNPHSATSFSVVFSIPDHEGMLLYVVWMMFIVVTNASVVFQALLLPLCRCGCTETTSDLLLCGAQ